MANGTNQELLQAFAMFGQAAQGYGISQAIQEANSQAQAIKASAASEAEKRRQLMDLARMASVDTAARGGSGIQVQALQTLAPPMPATLQSALIQGQLTGNQDLINIAQEGMQLEWERDLRRLRESARIQEASQMRQQAFADSQLDKRIAAQENMAQLKANQLTRPTEALRKDITEMDSAADTMTAILARMGGVNGTDPSADTNFINAVGPVVGRTHSTILGLNPWGGAEKVAAQQELTGLFQKYRQQMSGAAFSPQESAEYERSTPSVNDSPEVLRQKLATSLRLYQQSRTRMLDNAAAAKQDVSLFRQQAVPGFQAINAAPKGASNQAELARKFFTPGK